MRPEGVAAAAREVKRAKLAHRRITQAKTAEDAADAWDDFLTHANKVYLRLRAACYGHPLDWGWFGKKLDDRDSDALLLYIHKARNSETHRLDEITTPLSASSYFIYLKPLPVTDRAGAVFKVPTQHKGYRLGTVHVGTLSWLGGIYLQELVKEATSRLR